MWSEAILVLDVGSSMRIQERALVRHSNIECEFLFRSVMSMTMSSVNFGIKHCRDVVYLLSQPYREAFAASLHEARRG